MVRLRPSPSVRPSARPHNLAPYFSLHVHTITFPNCNRYEARGIKLVERKFFRQLGVNMYECTIGEKTK